MSGERPDLPVCLSGHRSEGISTTAQTIRATCDPDMDSQLAAGYFQLLPTKDDRGGVVPYQQAAREICPISSRLSSPLGLGERTWPMTR